MQQSRDHLFLPDLVSNQFAPKNQPVSRNQLIRNQLNDSAAHTDDSDEYESADEVHEPLCGKRKIKTKKQRQIKKKIKNKQTNKNKYYRRSGRGVSRNHRAFSELQTIPDKPPVSWNSFRFSDWKADWSLTAIWLKLNWGLTAIWFKLKFNYNLTAIELESNRDWIEMKFNYNLIENYLNWNLTAKWLKLNWIGIEL